MLYWPRPHGLYLAPFPEECRGTPKIRVQSLLVLVHVQVRVFIYLANWIKHVLDL